MSNEIFSSPAESTASSLLQEMDFDNGLNNRVSPETWDTEDNRAALSPHIDRMLRAGWEPCADDIGLIAAGEETERHDKFSPIDGYVDLDKTLSDIFNTSPQPCAQRQ